MAFRLYVKGLATREIESLLEEVFAIKLSKGSIFLITKGFEEERKAWLSRPLEIRYYFIYIDALYIALRRDTVAKESFYIVLGLKRDVRREILGIYNILSKSDSG